MKFYLSLKDPHLDIIEDLKKKYSISSSEDVVKKCIKSALDLQNDDLIFKPERENCEGGCFASEPHFEINIDEKDYSKLKNIFQKYDFDSYDTEEEEISKIIRCILNFVEEEPELITIQ